MREDYPRMTARYIVHNKVSRSKRGDDQVLQWGKKVEIYLKYAVRIITYLCCLYVDKKNKVKHIRRFQRKKKKK